MMSSKTNEAQRRKQAESIRRRGLEQMAEHDPSAAAKRQTQHKPYPAATLIREQGEQMRRESVDEFVARRGNRMAATSGTVQAGRKLGVSGGVG